MSSSSSGLTSLYSLKLNPNYATSRKPSLVFPRLGKRTPSGLLGAPGCSLGGSCHNRHCTRHGAQRTAALSPGWKRLVNKAAKDRDLLPLVHRRHLPCWPGQKVTHDPAAQPRWPCSRAKRTPLASQRAEPALQPVRRSPRGCPLASQQPSREPSRQPGRVLLCVGQTCRGPSHRPLLRPF